MKKKIQIFFILFFTICFSAKADREIDSLIIRIGKEINDEKKIELLLKLSSKFEKKSYGVAIDYATKSLNLSKKINSKKLMVKSYEQIARSNLRKEKYNQALNFYNKTLKLALEINDNSTIGKCYLAKGVIFNFKGELKKSQEFYFKALPIQKKINDNLSLGHIHNNIGEIYKTYADYKKAIKFYNEALKYYRNCNYIDGIITVYGNFGEIYIKTNNYSKSLEYFLKCLKLAEENNSEDKIADTYNYLGEIYKFQEEYEKAINYFKKSLEISENYIITVRKANSYYHIGEVYFEKKKYGISLEYNYKALRLLEDIGNNIKIIEIYLAVSKIYVMKNKFKDGINFLEKSLKMSEKINDKHSIASTNCTYAFCHFKMEEYEKAINFAEKSYIMGRKLKSPLIIQKSSKILSESFAIKKDFQNAYKFEILHSKLKDSLKSKYKIKKLTELELKYIFDKDKIDRRKKFKKVEKREKIYRTSFIIGVIAFIIIMSIIYISYIYRKKAFRIIDKKNKFMEEINKEINRKNEILETQKEEIEEQSEKQKKLNEQIFEDNIKIENQKTSILSRNEELEKQKEEISNKNLFVESQKLELEKTMMELKKKNEKIILQNAEVQQQKEEIFAQTKNLQEANEDIIIKNEELEIKQKLIEINNKNIIDNINYAKKIQLEVLTQKETIKKTFPYSFIFSKEKNIVSGDFPWFAENQTKIFFAAVDCTGEGIAGALISMIAENVLNEIVYRKKIFSSNLILKEMHKDVQRILRQKESDNYDGMDISICVIDKKKKILEYSGARSSLIYIKNNKTYLIKPDRLAIGGFIKNKKREYKRHEISFDKNTLFYVFSDGFYSQFGGEKGRKLLLKNFKKLLFEIHRNSLEKQGELLKIKFKNWTGKQTKVDNVLVIGIKTDFKDNYKFKSIYNWKNKTILVAEDNLMQFMIIKTIFKETEAIILNAKNGKEAVEISEKNQDICLVLMDLQMPIMDGYTALTIIKKQRKTLPIIVQTMATNSNEKTKSFQAGADDYITKPINRKELLSTVGKYLYIFYLIINLIS